MAIREDLVSSAVTFLQDQSVASAPLDTRVKFLQSKNLTQEEIDASLARADPSQPGQVTVQTNYTPQSQQVVQRPPPPPPSNQYAGHPPYQGYWQQPPAPPEVPRRDWRDYFIMATVMSGRYIYPLIAPPTPPQLEQDKAQIDEAFERAFNLIEQLSSDTANIKASEEQRTEKLDAAIADFERSVTELKEASHKRDDDTRRLGDDLRQMQDLIPKAMKTQEKNADDRLRDLGQELKSLKTLLANRMGAPAAASSPKPTASTNGASSVSAGSTVIANGPTPESSVNTGTAPTPEPQQDSANPLARFSAGKGGIPSWQMAATKTAESSGSQQEGNGSQGNVTG
ncbi:MAG: hypothetical protein Q9159_006005 [Coniocarpon cinnabarinum]